jgi:DNA-binding CsgD family transcriptional regulator
VICLRLLARIKETLSKPKSTTAEIQKKKTSVFSTRTRYGKKLSLSHSEKSQLVESLTPREKEAFFILLGGYSLKEAAEQLNVRYSTANTYQTAIYKKLNVNSRAELIINFREMCETGQG